MTGSCQKIEAVARLETSYLQRQLPELKEKGADHFSRLSGIKGFFCTLTQNGCFDLKLKM